MNFTKFDSAVPSDQHIEQRNSHELIGPVRGLSTWEEVQLLAAYKTEISYRRRYYDQFIAGLAGNWGTDSDCDSVTDRDSHLESSEDAGKTLAAIDLTVVAAEVWPRWYWCAGRVKQRLVPLVTEFERSLQEARRDEVDDDASCAQLLQNEFAYGLPGTDEDHETIMNFAEKVDPLVTITGHKSKWPRKVGYTGANKNWREV